MDPRTDSPFNILLFPLTNKLLCSKYVPDKIRLPFGGNRKYKFISINPLISGKRAFFQLMKYFGNRNHFSEIYQSPKIIPQTGKPALIIMF